MLNLKMKSAVVLAALCLAGVFRSHASGAEQEIVNYRLTAWRSAHFDDARLAATTADTLKHLGCETRQEPHGGHVDVAFRCPEWRAISLRSHDEAHQWESWLKSYGFQTSHQH